MPAPQSADLTRLARDLAETVEKVEVVWRDAVAVLDRGLLDDYQAAGENLQDFFANVFTGFAVVSEECRKAPGTPVAIDDELKALSNRLSALVEALDRTWPWIDHRAGLFHATELRAAVEEYRRGEFADLK
jgi:hypothetical protein